MAPQIAREFIDPDAEKVVRRLRRAGYEAYLVGGCVRDLLVGRYPKDFDCATSATPNEIKGVFRNSRIIGRRFRLAHVFFGQKIIETSTFRTNPREGADPEDDELLIRRDNVFGTAEEDARRRDFTINGLFYDVEADKVIDHVGGLADLEARLVRTIGDPEVRFPEDPVRILRAIKFAARLDFDIEPATYAALLNHEHAISQCAAPRVLEEVYRLMRGGAARRSFELLLETGVASTLAPELTFMFQGPPSFEGSSLGDDTDAFAEGRETAWRVLDALDDQVLKSAPPVPRPGRAASAAAALDPAAELAALRARTDLDELERAALAEVAAGERPVVMLPPEPGEATASSPVAARRTPTVPPPMSAASKPPPAPPPLAQSAASNAMLLAALVAPFVHEASDRPAEAYAAVEAALEPLSRRLRVARRDFERARQILIMVPRLAAGQRRRTRPQAMARRESFGDALLVAELLAQARGEDTEELVTWRQLARRAAAAGETEPDGDGPGGGDTAPEGAAGEGEGQRRRRRRRGGRRAQRDLARPPGGSS
jgi:poly(A) polymerase